MNTNTKNVGQTDTRAPYQPPQLQVWGAVSDLTRAGGSGGTGDVAYNPADKAVGRDDGSSTVGFA